MDDSFASTVGGVIILAVVWGLIGFLPGYIAGHGEKLYGDDTQWVCTRWENKPNAECTQWTMTEAGR